MRKNQARRRDYDFALIISGIATLTREVEGALFEAGCDDATLSIRHGLLYLEFTRASTNFRQAIFSAIRDVRKANIGAEILRVDDCNLVTQADIARRSERSRQQIHQFIKGTRGPGGFPPPECYLGSGEHPLWPWSAVSSWLFQNDMLRPEQLEEAEVISVINNLLEISRQQKRNPKLVREVETVIGTLERVGS